MSELNLTHSNGNKVKLTTPDTLAANKTFKLPGADGTSGQAMVTDGNGAFSFASIPAASVAGITMMDQWRISSDNNKGNNEVIDSNWERSDTFFAQIGTGMTQSSGVFTFPSTGIYLIMYQFNCQGTNMRYMGNQIEISPDGGSSYYVRAENYDSGGQTGYFGSSNCECIVDVTNASNYKVKFYVSSSGAITTEGDSTNQRTGVTFIKLGDT